MTTSKSDRLSPKSRKRARRSRKPLGSSLPSLPIRPVASMGQNQEQRYIGGLSDRERVDKILSDLHTTHRWTIKHLLYNMVTQEPLLGTKWGATTTKRAKDISMAVFEKPDVINALSHATNHV